MAKICSQKPPLAGGTLNICKSGTSKKALFWHISSILAMKGSQLWPLTHLKDKYYGKTELGKKIVKFGAPGTEIWLFKKKNMDRSIDCAVDHIELYSWSRFFLREGPRADRGIPRGPGRPKIDEKSSNGQINYFCKGKSPLKVPLFGVKM